jgi:hypothetical protein
MPGPLKMPIPTISGFPYDGLVRVPLVALLIYISCGLSILILAQFGAARGLALLLMTVLGSISLPSAALIEIVAVPLGIRAIVLSANRLSPWHWLAVLCGSAQFMLGLAVFGVNSIFGYLLTRYADGAP